MRDLAKSSDRVTIAFDDHTVGSFGPIRPVAIRALLDELAEAGVTARQVRLVCANALHRTCRPAELRRLLDDRLVDEFGDRLSSHDAEDPAQIADLGVTAEHGYPVEVSRLVTDSDLTIYVNTTDLKTFPLTAASRSLGSAFFFSSVSSPPFTPASTARVTVRSRALAVGSSIDLRSRFVRFIAVLLS